MKSKLTNRFSFDKNRWIISILNTGSMFSGHAMLLVEGVTSNNQLFIGQYDITAITMDEEKYCNSPEGLAKIRIYEGNKYHRDYSQYTRRSWEVSQANAQNMIDNIKKQYSNPITIINLPSMENAQIKMVPIAFHLKFQKVGNRSFKSNEERDAHNCVTWAEEKLTKAGITGLERLFDILAASPEKHATAPLEEKFEETTNSSSCLIC